MYSDGPKSSQIRLLNFGNNIDIETRGSLAMSSPRYISKKQPTSVSTQIPTSQRLAGAARAAPATYVLTPIPGEPSQAAHQLARNGQFQWQPRVRRPDRPTVFPPKRPRVTFDFLKIESSRIVTVSEYRSDLLTTLSVQACGDACHMSTDDVTRILHHTCKVYKRINTDRKSQRTTVGQKARQARSPRLVGGSSFSDHRELYSLFPKVPTSILGLIRDHHYLQRSCAAWFFPTASPASRHSTSAHGLKDTSSRQRRCRPLRTYPRSISSPTHRGTLRTHLSDSLEFHPAPLTRLTGHSAARFRPTGTRDVLHWLWRHSSQASTAVSAGSTSGLGRE
ncbi:unnamed protein product [Spodoptera littoralis]|uniref:Uncharacterized protein n=1 Tax=Spodoptera littoralis TaxID=7109 RepID=A0A9P0HWP7_SPOLI|nr:unnamed protein product [Spodoptera littoralis]CAH1634934.1 unnamed protein product [Spodoptera littoralis]